MTLANPITRRGALFAGAGAGLSLTFLGKVAYGASEGAAARRKLVVIVCRGAMDGLSVSPPIGDPNYASLRRQIAIPAFGQAGGALKLDSTFGLHPKLEKIHGLALQGQARIAPAVATPDRARSHFEAQDLLENGTDKAYGIHSGWLNRTLEALRPARKVEAISIGDQTPLLLQGRVQTASWAPGLRGDADPRLTSILQDLYANDPLLGPALSQGMATDAMADQASMTGEGTMAEGRKGPGGPEAAARSGATLGRMMASAGGPQVAALSLYGFDTHHGQGGSDGALANRLAVLDATVDGLRQGLGTSWNDTAVLVVTEFGRTARVNGTSGTDHGTASTALLIGGSVRTGGVIGDWPTLQPARLFENRDTAPTLDMRGLFKGVLADQLGVERAALDTVVFPDSAAVQPVRGLVA